MRSVGLSSIVLRVVAGGDHLLAGEASGGQFRPSRRRNDILPLGSQAGSNASSFTLRFGVRPSVPGGLGGGGFLGGISLASM